MSSRGPAHPLARRQPHQTLGRYAKPKEPVVTPPDRAPVIPPPEPGKHLWILLRWNVITDGQAHQLAQGKARVEPKERTLIAGQVGCYWCHQGYDQVNVRCGAFPDPDPDDESVEIDPQPLEPAEEGVPVDPPTPPDAGPPAVELELAGASPALARSIAAPTP